MLSEKLIKLNHFQISKCVECEDRGGVINYNKKARCDYDSKCFPSFSKVSLSNGKSVRMSELQIGDEVQSGMHLCHLPW